MRGSRMCSCFIMTILFLLYLRKEHALKESRFQSKLIKKLESKFPNCVVMKNDANYRQGIPDLSIHYKGKTAFLECKDGANAGHQPNQDYWVERLKNDGFYANFIFPENERSVLSELERSFEGCQTG